MVDLLVWVLAALLCMLWRWVGNKSEIVHYWALFGVLAVGAGGFCRATLSLVSRHMVMAIGDFVGSRCSHTDRRMLVGIAEDAV